MRYLYLFVASLFVVGSSSLLGELDQATSDLFTGLEKGDKVLIYKSLEGGADINAKSVNGATPLAMALRMGGLDIFKSMVEGGGDIHARYRYDDESARLLLHDAVSLGQIEFVKYLLDNGAAIESRSAVLGYTPLHLAVARDQLELVKLLVERGANLYTSNNFDYSIPVELAKKYRRAGVANYLEKVMREKYHLDQPEPEWTRFIDRTEPRNIQVDIPGLTEYIRQAGSIHQPDHQGYTVLHYVAGVSRRNMELLEILVEYSGMKVNAQSVHGETPLYRAVRFDCVEVVRFLLDHDADVNLCDLEGNTPLIAMGIFIASGTRGESDEFAIAEMLLAKGADVNAQNVFGRSALHEVAEDHMSRFLETAQLLIVNGADVNLQALDGKTALSVAANIGTVDMVELLIKHGAKVDIVDIENESPISRATFREDKKMLALLVEHSENKSPALETPEAIESDESDQEEMVALSEEQTKQQMQEVVIQQIAEQSGSDFHLAVAGGKIQVVKEMLKKGQVDVNGLDGLGSLALMYAVFLDHQEMVTLLLENGGDVNLLDGNGGTALVVAVSAGHKEMVEMLLATGADPYIEVVDDGMNVLEVAKLTGHDEIATIIQTAAPDLEFDMDSIFSEQMEDFSTDEEEIQTQEMAIQQIIDQSGSDFHLAVVRGEIQVVKDMVKKGQVDINGLDDLKALALSYAVFLNNQEMAALLLGNGAEINKLDGNETTALLVAVASGHKAMVIFLLAAGADPSVKMGFGVNALEMAMMTGQDEIATIIQNAAPDLEADMEGLATSEESFTNQENHWLKDRLASHARQPFHVAVIKGEKAVVQEMLAAGQVDVNGFDDSRRLALAYAAYFGHKEIVTLLLEYGGEINKLDDNPSFNEWGRTLDDSEQGWGVLHYLAESGNVEMMRFMVEKGANVNMTDKQKGQTPLFIAVEYDHRSMIEALIQVGADVDIIDKWSGRAVIHEAAYKGNLEQVKLLTSLGATLESQDKRGRTAIILAMGEGHSEIVEYWLEHGGSLDGKDSQGNTLLFSAVTNPANYTTVKKYIDLGADVNVENSQLQTPLFYAVEDVDNTQMIELLLEHGAEINHPDQNGATPLFWYVSKMGYNHQRDEAKEKNYPNAWALLRHGADPSVHGDEEENSILHMAAQYELIDIARWLIESGADVNIVNRHGNTPLHAKVDPYAQQGKSMEIVRMLVENGADLTLHNGRGQSTLHSAVERNWPEVVAYLIENGAAVNVHETGFEHATPLHGAIGYQGSVEMVELLIANGAVLNAQDKSGETPLHYAVRKNLVDLAQLLVEAGARYDIQNKRKETALDIAQKKQRDEILSLFIE